MPKLSNVTLSLTPVKLSVFSECLKNFLKMLLSIKLNFSFPAIFII